MKPCGYEYEYVGVNNRWTPPLLGWRINAICWMGLMSTEHFVDVTLSSEDVDWLDVQREETGPTSSDI